MRKLKVRISSYRFHVFRFRFLQKLRNESALLEAESQVHEASDSSPENNDVLKYRRRDILVKKLLFKIKKKLRNIQNTIFFCGNTIKDIFGQTFCFIMLKKTKSSGILKTVKI